MWSIFLWSTSFSSDDPFDTSTVLHALTISHQRKKKPRVLYTYARKAETACESFMCKPCVVVNTNPFLRLLTPRTWYLKKARSATMFAE